MKKNSDEAINLLNKKYNSINLGDFYNTDYCDYAIYRALQRIPNLLDGFAQTQRKVIYTCVDQNIDKKMKVSDLAAVVSLATKYHHGAGSIETAITGLVPLFNNQVPLLREDGTYGSRSERDPSASRYIETRLFKYSKIIFISIDNANFIESQTSEGKKIEPKYLLPIIPLLLINGQKQIGVGYACDILPRDVNVVLGLIKDILTGKRKDIPTNIPPCAPLFKGEIVANPDGGWDYLGIAKENAKGDIHITEVPPSYTREKYLTILEKLKDSGKIKSYVENIVGDEFDIIVKLGTDSPFAKVKKGSSQTPRERELAVLDFFKLIEKKSENITVINTQDIIKRYNNIAEVLFEYIMYMLSIYKKRKEFILEKMKIDSIMNREKIRFITAVNDGTLIIRNRKKSDIYLDLEAMQFTKISEDYEYLLRMQIANLTAEKIIELEEQIKEDAKTIAEFSSTSAAQIWLKDIEEFEKLLKKGD